MKSKFIQIIAELRRCLVAFGAIFVLLLSSFAAAPTVNVISINVCQSGNGNGAYADGIIDTNDTESVYSTFVGDLPGNAWIRFDGKENTGAPPKYPDTVFARAWNGASQAVTNFAEGITISASLPAGYNNYDRENNTNHKTYTFAPTYLKSWMAKYSGERVNNNIQIADIPYSRYTAVIYCAGADKTSENGKQFEPLTVNGTQYTYVNGELSSGSGVWGDALYCTNGFAVGQNTMVVSGLSGTFTLSYTMATAGMAALQIVEEEIPEPEEPDVPDVISINVSQSSAYAAGVINTNGTEASYSTLVGSVPATAWISMDGIDSNGYNEREFDVGLCKSSGAAGNFESAFRVGATYQTLANYDYDQNGHGLTYTPVYMKTWMAKKNGEAVNVTFSVKDIPFERYTAMIYCAGSALGDARKNQFKALSVNGSLYTYTSGLKLTAASSETEFWGDVSYCATGPVAGKNVMVVPGLTGDLTVQYAMTYAGIAAVQIVREDPVARIGAASYHSLADACAAANRGDVVELLTDVTEGSFVVSDGVTVDLLGHTLTRLDSNVTFYLTGSSTVSNGSISVAGDYESSGRPVFTVQDGSTPVIDGVSVGNSVGKEPLVLVGRRTDTSLPVVSVSTSSNSSYAPDKSALIDGNLDTRWQASGGDSTATVTVDLGSIVPVSRLDIVWDDVSATGGNVDVSSDGSTWTTIVNWTDDTDPKKKKLVSYDISSAGSARYVRWVTTERSSGAAIWGVSMYEFSVYGSDESGSGATSATLATISGGEWHACALEPEVTNGDASTVSITGGRFYLREWFVGTSSSQNLLPVISGGAFQLDPKAYLADGYVVQHVPSDVDTPYHVVPADSVSVQVRSYWYDSAESAVAARVAKVGESYYSSIADAVRAANAEDTVEIVADVTALEETVVVYKNLTIKGNGHTVKVRTPYVEESGYVAQNYTKETRYVFVVNQDVTASISDVSVMGGGGYAGEGILNNGILTLDNVTITRSCGGFYNAGDVTTTPWISSRAYLYNCRIVRNCRYCGGGILNDWGCLLVMDRSSLSENRSLDSHGGGGACENRGTMCVNNCVIANNASTEKGGAFNEYSGFYNSRLYMMNSTLAGNFTTYVNENSQMGGGVAIRTDDSQGYFYSVNNIICNNYQVGSEAVPSDLAFVIHDTNKHVNLANIHEQIVHTLYGAFLTDKYDLSEIPVGQNVMTNNIVADASASVFNAYSSTDRVYENARRTAVPVNGAQLVSKDDGSLDASLARYAPIDETGIANIGNDGVYTYFDASDWQNGNVKMSYRTKDGEMTALGNLTAASVDNLVTNYYESTGMRALGILGASGPADAEHYTLTLAQEPVYGSVSGITLYGDSYVEGKIVEISATPDFGCTFKGWFNADGSLFSSSPVCSVTMTHDYSLYALFEEDSTIAYEVTAKQGDEDAVFPIVVTRTWLEANVAGVDYSDTDAVKANLNAVDSATGLKKWHEYVLGLTPGDQNAKIWIRSPQLALSESSKIRMQMNALSLVKGTGFTVKYAFDKKLSGASEFSNDGALYNSSTFDIDVSAGDPTGLYRIELAFIPDGYSTSNERVTTVNTAGVLRVAAPPSVAVVSVPWVEFSPSGSSSISAASLVRTMNLTAGDNLYVYDKANSLYRTWQLKSSGEWSPLTTYALVDGVVSSTTAGAPGATTIPRGDGIWLERQNADRPVYLVGQYDSASVTTQLASGWNLIANPAGAALDVNEKFANPAEGDRIVIPTGGAPLNCTYSGGEWGYYKSITFKEDGDTFVKSVRETTDVAVPAGRGFWYISVGENSVEW